MIIGLHGEAGSGKDFAADYLCSKSWYDKTSFAKPIYDMINCLGFDASSSMDREEKESSDNFLGVSLRRMLQTLGTEWGRDLINKDIWIKVAEHNISEFSNVIITDVRFDNEAEMVIKKNGIVINIISPNNPNSTKQKHVSEVKIKDEYIYTVIENDYTDNFKKCLDNFWDDLNVLINLNSRMTV